MIFKTTSLMFFFLVSNPLWAQELEGPPSEPPYTNGDAEVIEELGSPVGPEKKMTTSAIPGQRNKGLIRITRNGEYIYKPTLRAGQENTGTMKFGQIDPVPNISGRSATNSSGVDYHTTYTDVYGTSKPFLATFEYEWKPFTGFGKLGAVGSMGFFTSAGTGRFVDGNLIGQEAREKFTFYGLPLGIGGIYRFEYGDHQWFSPYIAGGGSLYLLIETRNDDSTTKYVGVPAFWGAGGLLVNISAIDKETGFALDSEYGVSAAYIVLDYKVVRTNRSDLDIGANIISGGMAVDF